MSWTTSTTTSPHPTITTQPDVGAAPTTPALPPETFGSTTTATSDTQEPTDVAICIDSGDYRVIDDLCPDTEDEADSELADQPYRHFWYHHTSYLAYPAVGMLIDRTAGSFARPVGDRVYDRGVPVTGGRVLRGVLGSPSHRHSHGG
ncbi:hypothetical protein EBN03_03765 [Nocardia stercoris]|uniref:Uncharacterized protein n=1 Tax=Nocardia stercoris TaxID=2483361 RepID=A0A3M2LHB1_9NOCA|nr:hypothetical protein EBN03_03765 [Nocardia stercoris]